MLPMLLKSSCWRQGLAILFLLSTIMLQISCGADVCAPSCSTEGLTACDDLDCHAMWNYDTGCGVNEN